MLPELLKRSLQKQLLRAHLVHEKDLARRYGRVALPYALARKYPGADREFGKTGLHPAPCTRKRIGLLQPAFRYKIPRYLALSKVNLVCYSLFTSPVSTLSPLPRTSQYSSVNPSVSSGAARSCAV